MIKFALEAPWATFCKKLKALFDADPDIEVSDMYEPDDSNADYSVAIMVKKHEKFVALDRLLPGTKTFGNVTLDIDLYDEENDYVNTVELFNTAFADNPIIDSIQTRTDSAGVEWGYVLFKPEVVQFFDDDLSDYNGLWSGLAEDIAREVFEENCRGVGFCTAPVVKPTKISYN